MSGTTRIRNITLGVGRPKIAVPIIGTNKEEIITQAAKAKDTQPDLIEWRIDYFEQVMNFSALQSVGQELRQTIGDIALLTTFRTKNEGGQIELAHVEDYADICQSVLQGKFTDAIDIERFYQDDIVKQIVQLAHQDNVIVIMSNHDFVKTPSAKDIKQRLLDMIEFGADAAKIAVMPESLADVLTLMTATQEASKIANRPLITMSMGDIGKVSRIAGEVFGSTVTFATVGAASAPGQIPIEHLRQDLIDLQLDPH
ncbi:type I 3-dehydroquinate dehydratase [Xylocopilactobacillus apis]|uniref:3-dehydroquinate dehydratase n=1 Tax=Xylocopilactobacillus apis TaxID=2932183 RepID=A0AAU9DN32_9LACO|nr:type I 3-dehydroquinate dehydratase [Xylocopilactobacillus apis]BDR57109.1 3-dehydroquinate dehydratase [Xylocopilactobacillus apis]